MCCVVLYVVSFFCVVVNCVELYCLSVLDWIVLSCSATYRGVRFCIVWYPSGFRCIVLCGIVLLCVLWFYIVVRCSVLW